MTTDIPSNIPPWKKNCQDEMELYLADLQQRARNLQQGIVPDIPDNVRPITEEKFDSYEIPANLSGLVADDFIPNFQAVKDDYEAKTKQLESLFFHERIRRYFAEHGDSETTESFKNFLAEGMSPVAAMEKCLEMKRE